MSIHDQKQLLTLVSRGDQDAFGTLFHQYFDVVYSVALSFTKSPELAKDTAQEVFIRIWHYRSKLAEVNNFEHWLARVARNYIRNVLKKKVLATSNEAGLLSYLQDKDPSGQEKMEWKEQESRVMSIIAKLPPQMQQAFRLSRLEGLSHEQIALKMNISKVTSQNHVARALLLLRRYFHDHKDQFGMLLLTPLCYF